MSDAHSPLTYRTAGVRDLPVILAGERSYMEDFHPEAVPGWARVLDQNLALWIDCLDTSGVLVNADGTIVGFALWRFRDEAAELVTVHVLQQQRGRGLGARLVDAFLAAAMATDLPRAALAVHQRNTPARRLYVSRGFQVTGAKGVYDQMERRLTPS